MRTTARQHSHGGLGVADSALRPVGRPAGLLRTILLVPWALDALTWQWAFAVLAPGPFLGILAMLRLQRSPQARLIDMGRG